MPGETLYLPVGWWHYVRQSGITVALNWWYDAELRGMSWIMLNFLRNPVEISPVNDDDEE
jgi:jumonji domain-containing protein 7